MFALVTFVRFHVPTKRLVPGFIALLVSVLFMHAAPLQAETKRSPFENGPKTIASRERVSVLIDREVANGKSSILLKISVPTDSKINAFLLPDPPRLVVDFEGASIKKSENFSAPENGVIKQIRLGAHPEKLRVVVDLIKSTPPEYEWKAGKRQAIISFVEGPAEAPAQPTQQPVQPTSTQAAAQPTAVPALPTEQPTAAPTAAPSTVPTTPPTSTPAPAVTTPAEEPTKSVATEGVIGGQAAQLPLALDEQADTEDLGDLEQRSVGPAPTKVPTTFSIKGYKFEYMPDKSPVLKILLNKPRAQAQISKVDSETYKIDIKDCGVDNEDLELPQFPPHDFVGFVMVVSETVGKNVEVSISVEEDIVLGTAVQENEIWVKKP
jgi:hypothetical protein